MSDVRVRVRVGLEDDCRPSSHWSFGVAMSSFVLVTVIGLSTSFIICAIKRARVYRYLNTLGIPMSVIEALYPVRKYSEVAPFGVADDCSICLEKYVEDTEVRVMPCRHAYHAPCIDGWFRDNQTCCLCKLNCRQLPEDEVDTGIDNSESSSD